MLENKKTQQGFLPGAGEAVRGTQIFVDRPGLERTLNFAEFSDPLEVLADDHAYLKQALDRLTALADDQHLVGREELAAGLHHYFSNDFDWMIADQAELLDLLESKPRFVRLIGSVAKELRREGVMIRRLLPPVLHRLRQIADRGLVDDPSVFVIAALVFSEFVRMHADLEDATLLPLGNIALARNELKELGIDMVLRRGLGV